MSKFRFRCFLDDAVFVVLIMVGAVIAAGMETQAVLGAMADAPAATVATAEPPSARKRQQASASAPSGRTSGDAVVARLGR